jgi:hypothetical protein
MGSSLLSLMQDAVDAFPSDAVMLSCRAKTSLIMVSSSPLSLDEFLAKQVLNAAILSPISPTDAILLLDSFFSTTLFVENEAYKTRSSLMLEVFVHDEEQNMLVWDGASAWYSSAMMTGL